MGKQKRRSERRGFLSALADGLLSLIDALCGLLAGAFMALARLMGRILRLVFRGLFALLRGAFRLLTLPLRLLFNRKTPLERCLDLTGEEFEDYCAGLLRDNGYHRVRLTPLGGDQGADILCVKDGETWAVQCKNYRAPVGNAAVQEIAAGRDYYGCDRAAVLTPSTYTPAAIDLAEATDVALWDGDELLRMIRRSGRKPRAR